MKANRIALFRYHNCNYEDLRARLKFFKLVNPEVRIFGIFGGDREKFNEATENLKEYVRSNYLFDHPSQVVKARSGEITYQSWYRDIGREVDFEVMHPFEWDLVFMENLDILYGHIPKDGIGCSGLVKMNKVEERWYWTRHPKRKKEWNDILTFVKSKYNYQGTPYAMQGPATSIPKIFLNGLLDIEIPQTNIDEVKIPLFAQIMGLKLYDNGFYRKWFSKEEEVFFNCNKIPIKFETIEQQMKKRKGRRVFHPYMDDFDFDKFNLLRQ